MNKIEVKLDWFWVPFLLAWICLVLMGIQQDTKNIADSLEKIASSTPIIINK